MTVTQVTVEDLRKLVESVLSQYKLSFEDFVKSDLDDLTDAELRDLWLMYHDVFAK